MSTVRIGGRIYSDPDVIALSAATGRLVDPRSAVLNQARQANSQYREFASGFADPLKRIKIIASLKGIRVDAMDIERSRSEERDAVLISTSRGRQILYNPDRPSSRVAFSIAHEISHTFFPNTGPGARFRNLHESDSREANELERLCDLGAAELLMPIEDFQAHAAGEYSLLSVERLSRLFGASFEATAYRLATANPGKAVAGLLRYRLTISEARLRAKNEGQQQLFTTPPRGTSPSILKYRRQSLYISDHCNDEYWIPWNKSFEQSSAVYKASNGGVVQGYEELPNKSRELGRLEAVLAPYQRGDAHSEFGDVLFLWTKN